MSLILLLMQQILVNIKSVAVLFELHFPCLVGGHVYKRWRDVVYTLKLIGCALKGISAHV